MLYQTVRPNSFEEVRGNKAAVSALKKAVKAKEHAHVYLFTGPSGCGKTTLARIMAKELGCSGINTIEKNAANERGIDMTRQLEELAVFSPLGGGNRMVILDECHSLTRQAQDSLLKVLEDVPAYQYYALCSTDPQKLLKTIRTRCDRVEVGLLDDKALQGVLDDAIDKEKLEDPDDDIYYAIIDAAEGCPRIALMLLEKQRGMEKDEAIQVIKSYSGSEAQTIDLCRALVKGKWEQLLLCYNNLTETDSEKTRHAVLGYLHSCLAKSKGRDAGRFAKMIEPLVPSVMYSGKAGLLSAMYNSISMSKNY